MWACLFIAWLQARVFCRSPWLHGGLWSCQATGNGSTYDGSCGEGGLGWPKCNQHASVLEEGARGPAGNCVAV